MPEPLVLVMALALAGTAVLLPLRSRTHGAATDDDVEAAAVRHRVALEALRDVEADRRAGSLDDAAYAAQLSEAEARAAATSAALRQRRMAEATSPASTRGRRVAVASAAIIGAVLIVGSLLPGTGIANTTVVNEQLAALHRAEDDRQARIAELRRSLAANPRDPAILSELADAHLAGSSRDELQRAVVALQVLVALEPDRADAYERIMAAYLRAGDHANARAAWSSYAERSTADPVELAFFDGLIALRGENDPARAREAFDRFLELAPDDPRAPMISGLRDEAAGEE